MNFNELKELIEKSLTGETFKLETKGQPRLETLGTNYLTDAKLELSSASVAAEAGEAITVKGTGTGLPFKGMAVMAEFYLIDGTVALDMKAITEKADWKFEEAIPAFKDTIANKIPFKDTPAKPTFYLLSDAKPAKDGKEAKASGLTFDATIAIDKIPDKVRDILGIDTEKVVGPIVLKDHGKEIVSIELTGPNLLKVGLGDLGTFTLTVKISSDTLENADKTKKVVPFVELSTFIPIKGDVNIEIIAKISDTSSVVRFDARLDKVTNVGFIALAEKLGDIGLTGSLPDNFNLEDHVQLAKLYIDFNIKEKSIALAAFKLASQKKWEISTVNDNPFNASELSLQFGIDYPFNKEKRAVSLKIDGEVTLTQEASLVISASKPGFKVKGSLKKDSKLVIKDFIKQFVGPAQDVPDIITIEKLDFNKDSEGYSFKTMLNGSWQIDAEKGTELSVSNLTFDLDYKSAKKERTAKFIGALKIDTVDVKVTANYANSGDAKGWKFNGTTGDDQQIPMGKFIDYMAKNFKAGNPPAWVKTINLHNLATNFNTQTKEFDFKIKGNIAVGEGKTLLLELDFKLEKKDSNYQKTLSGLVTINTSIFDLNIVSGEDENRLAAGWILETGSDPLQIKDIASRFGMDSLPAIPEGFDLGLIAANLRYDFDLPAFVFTAKSKNYGHAVFVAKKIGKKWVCAFGLHTDADVKLNDLPLIGADLAAIAGDDVGLNGIKLIGLSATIAADEIKNMNKLINVGEDEGYPELPESDKALSAAAYIVLQLDLGPENTYDYKFDTAKEQKPQLIAISTDADSGGIKWKDLQKNIGPVHFKRVGIGYKDKRISLLLDAALVFSVLKIEMMALGVSNPIDAFDPAFELSGVNIAYKNGPVEIAGSFLKTKSDKLTEYSGTAVIALKNFRLTALGSYASVDGNPSLFVFAMMATPLGGPPCFFVTGIAAGFGYNRSLKVPGIDNVADFPLVSAFAGKGSPFKSNDPKEALQVLMEKGLVPPAIGQNWLAAGIQFTSFQLVHSFALMTVLFGTTFEIGLLGTSEVSIPPAIDGQKVDTPLAFAKLALNARILPETGVVSVEAKLTPESYILSKKCLLTGGFAFYIWTAPSAYAGDFVVTLGGYHPDFKVPAHYPKVPRLGFNWQVSNEVLVKGSMYFAITPTCLMAGGLLEATYNSGNLKAWFIMGADFLIAWQPYYYSARMYVSFGVQYTFNIDLLFTTITETLSVSIGADLKVWGPEFSGVASIHLWIISFDVSFGAADNTKPAELTWEDFQKSFLPPSENKRRVLLQSGNLVIETETYCYSKLTDGLEREIKPEDNIKLNWIVNRDGTEFESYTIYPSKKYEIKILDSLNKKVDFKITNPETLAGRNEDFGVGMVKVENEDFFSTHVVTIKLNYEVPAGTRSFDVFAVLANVPKSLWEDRETGFDEDSMIENVLVGFKFRPRSLTPQKTLPIELAQLEYFYETYPVEVAFAVPTLILEPAQPEDAIKVLKESIKSATVAETRTAILQALSSRGKKFNAINVDRIAANAENMLLAPPVIKYSYWKKSA